MRENHIVWFFYIINDHFIAVQEETKWRHIDKKWRRELAKELNAQSSVAVDFYLLSCFDTFK